MSKSFKGRAILAGSLEGEALVTHVSQGATGRRVITRLDTDDRPDTLASPQLRACVRGRAYLRRQ